MNTKAPPLVRGGAEGGTNVVFPKTRGGFPFPRDIYFTLLPISVVLKKVEGVRQVTGETSGGVSDLIMHPSGFLSYSRRMSPNFHTVETIDKWLGCHCQFWKGSVQHSVWHFGLKTL